ncbi:hypothetical protein FHW89_001663 [Mucilaginibacter sp. SG564]|nr:FAD-dependent monooxygenase [Mucilaginibacter sp. SG564]NOW95002.1 hypothetical protein [Mucilaginibacter sp. SG564]
MNVRRREAYRVGNAFIAGDSGHVHLIAGGMGMNTGIHDAYNWVGNWRPSLMAKPLTACWIPMAKNVSHRRLATKNYVAKTKGYDGRRG